MQLDFFFLMYVYIFIYLFIFYGGNKSLNFPEKSTMSNGEDKGRDFELRENWFHFDIMYALITKR